MITVEFRNRIPDGCIDWLWDNVGSGNYPRSGMYFTRNDDGDWFYSRYPAHNEHIASVKIRDEKMAALFVLRWV